MIVTVGRDRFAAITWSVITLLGAAMVLRLVGVPPIDVHGLLHYVGIMDPLCGGTRAMYLLATGDIEGAARYNPVMFPLVTAMVAVLARAMVGRTTGRWWHVQLSRTTTRVLIVGFIVGMAALTVRQQLYVDLMTQPWR